MSRFFFLGLSLLLTSGHASASLIRVNFSGTITVSQLSAVPEGSSFTGFAYYDTAFQVSSYGPPGCLGLPIECAAHYALPFPFEVTVNGSTITSLQDHVFGNNLQVTDSNPLGSPQVSDGASWLAVGYHLDITGPLAAQRLSAFDALDVAFRGPNTMLVAPALGPIFPGFDQWTPSLSLIDFLTADGFGQAESRDFQGHITSVSFDVVPEPGTVSFVGVVLLIAIVARARK